MPPAAKINRDMVVHAGFELIREQGIDCVSARSLADKLNCSVKPLFRLYENMDACKADIMTEVYNFYNNFMEKRIKLDDQLLTISLAYTELAQTEHNLFQAMFVSNLNTSWSVADVLEAEWNQGVIEQTMIRYNISRTCAKKLFRDTWLYTHGVATQIYGNAIVLSSEEITDLITHAIKCFMKGE
ncbi:TetR/AcrR family transcriptional regulator [Oceanirhabdus seepicola]|uniref:TetR/AcrR family transcriptional regulator n=1 Tax=Oceanirhabdus seepicola TaxID=2828781 RepID=A0A9J6P7P7_9CLOT|nr:TetR/AcrR family transcriptional regulator [Oceanirhabdus seepicola]MCM1991829.1 TetR/AcrR family transcriptional regulator [Oceanirhabdus seepicola]